MNSNRYVPLLSVNKWLNLACTVVFNSPNLGKITLLKKVVKSSTIGHFWLRALRKFYDVVTTYRTGNVSILSSFSVNFRIFCRSVWYFLDNEIISYFKDIGFETGKWYYFEFMQWDLCSSFTSFRLFLTKIFSFKSDVNCQKFHSKENL